MIFGTTLTSIPSAVPYLHADPDQSAKWRDLLASLPGRKVGLVWAGSRYDGGPGGNNIDSRRSITLGHFAPLAAVPGLSLVSLQKGEAVRAGRNAAGRNGAARLDERSGRLRRYRRFDRRTGFGRHDRHVGHAPRGCDGQTGLGADLARPLLALADPAAPTARGIQRCASSSNRHRAIGTARSARVIEEALR